MLMTVHAEIGDYVEKGSVLASIRSQEIANLTKERQAAEQQKRIAERNYQAAEEMFSSGMKCSLRCSRWNRSFIDYRI